MDRELWHPFVTRGSGGVFRSPVMLVTWCAELPRVGSVQNRLSLLLARMCKRQVREVAQHPSPSMLWVVVHGWDSIEVGVCSVLVRRFRPTQ